MLNLTDNIWFDCWLLFRYVVHHLLMSSFNHLTEHVYVLLPLFDHLFHVNLDIILEKLSLLLALLVFDILFTLHMTQSLILILKLELDFFLLSLHLFWHSHNLANDLFLTTVGQLIYPSVHFTAYICDTIIQLKVKLVSNSAQNLLWLLYLTSLILDTFMDFISKLIECLLVSLERLLLSDKIEVFCRGPPKKLLINLSELIFEF